MKIKESLYFNRLEYERKLEALVANQGMNDIREREVLKNRQIYGYSTKIGMGAILWLPTMGLSTFTSLVGFRQLWVACSKLEVVNGIIKKYKITPYQCNLRDRVIPIVINVLTAGIGFGTSALLSEISTMGVEGASAQGLVFDPPTSLGEIADSAAANPSAFADGFFHGAEAQVDAASAALGPGNAAANVTQATMENAVPLSVGGEFMDGGNVGYASAAVVERFLVQHAVASSLEHMADQSARNELYRRITQDQQVAEMRPSEEMYKWHQELDEVQTAIQVQYVELVTAHSELLNRGSTERNLEFSSMKMRDQVVSLDSRARDDCLNAEDCQKARFVNAWVCCLKRWEEILKKQAIKQAEWQIIINKWQHC
ncbi:uncharacterized protein BKA55DRAFT_598344 [Fusarium redolens]|uniref:Uncharacterized protein n=1 Tax=Fusarium redolens TaxID=48865 RepID=A0A9P9JXG7_FUSRE|nr:uncharacterized protein BKA55DRAFT_598344 [Fusarium redolens]KAH7232394.1 hypothetical protein BKA55DRAFT_598344 [Fusarium redolens]